MVHVVMEAEKLHNLPFADQRPKKASGIVPRIGALVV